MAPANEVKTQKKGPIMSKIKRTPTTITEDILMKGAIVQGPTRKEKNRKNRKAHAARQGRASNRGAGTRGGDDTTRRATSACTSKGPNSKQPGDAIVLRPAPEDTMASYIARRRRHMTILVCEHKQTFCTVRSLMHDEGQTTFFGQRIDGVVYGQQGAFAHAGVLPAFESHACRRRRGLARLFRSLRFARKPKVRYLYWGDVDSESIQQIMTLYRANPGTPISPFMPAYRCMIDRATGRKLRKTDGAPAGPFCLRIAKHLDPRRRLAYENVLTNGLSIPQQLVDKQVLRAHKAG